MMSLGSNKNAHEVLKREKKMLDLELNDYVLQAKIVGHYDNQNRTNVTVFDSRSLLMIQRSVFSFYSVFIFRHLLNLLLFL